MLQPDRRASARRVEAVWSRSRDTLLGGRVGAGHDGGSARSEGSGREGGDGVADDDEHVRRPPADEYLAWATLADGLRVAARFQKPHDAEALVAGFEHLSESSLVRRFLTPKDHLTTADLDQLVGSVDQVDHLALMLFWRRRDHDVLIGEGRFIRLPSSPEDAEVKQAFMSRAARVVALCDSSKFNRKAMVRVAAPTEIHALVCEAEPDPLLSGALARAGVSVIVA